MKNLTVIPTILQLLSSTVLCQQKQNREVNLINRLNAFYGFDHNIFFVDSTDDPNRYISTKTNNEVNSAPQTIFKFNQNLDYNNETQPALMKSVTSKKTFLIVFAKTLTFDEEIQLWGQVKVIRRLDRHVKIAIFFVHNVTSMDLIEQVFRWSWKTGIVNIFCAFYYNFRDVAASSLNIFRFDPFPTLNLIDVTQSMSLANYFYDKVPNYRQYPFLFVRNIDTDLQNQELKFWQTVVTVFNASMSIFNFTLEKSLALKNTEYAFIQESVYDESTQIYPHQMVKVALTVPHALPYSNFSAYLRNATWTHVFAYFTSVIVAASLQLIISGYLQKKKFSFFQRIADVINLLMNDNSRIRYQLLPGRDVWVVVPLTFTGLIVANGILATFKSYITLPIYERQIQTLEDLYKSPLNIWITEHYWANRMKEVLQNITGFGRWGERVLGMKRSDVAELFVSFNTSIAYLSFSNQAETLLEAQRRLGIKAYYVVPNLYLHNFFASYDLNEYFPFFDEINDLNHRLQAAGLWDKWYNDNEDEWIKERWKRNLKLQFKTNGESENKGLTQFIIVCGGWIASTIVFVCELIWSKLSRQLIEVF